MILFSVCRISSVKCEHGIIVGVFRK